MYVACNALFGGYEELGYLLTIYNEIDLVILVIIEFTLLLSSSVLVLLVLGDEIVHVGLGLGELHLIHTLSGIPVLWLREEETMCVS